MIVPNQSVERTGMSRSVQCQLQRQWRLIPVAHLYRSARARDAGSFEQEATEMDSVLCFLGYLLLNL